MIKYTPIIQKLSSDLFAQKQIDVSVLRLDLIDPVISGNKWFKLKRNLQEAKNSGLTTILTFGGAFSNHIHATAAACQRLGFKSIGVIRGEQESSDNITLREAAQMGMKLHFVSRDEYKRKESEEFIKELKSLYGDFYLIPEGGNNYLGALGASEILENINDFDFVFCSVGTATTFSGLAKNISNQQYLIGVSPLKGEGSLLEEAQERIHELRNDDFKIYASVDLMNDEVVCKSGILNKYHFGGFAKHTPELLEFKLKFEEEFNIPLDYIYESKLMYAVMDLIQNNKLPKHTKVVIVHGGGLQGNRGYEDRYVLNAKRNVNDPQG